MSGAPQPVAELDVLDRRVAEAAVEPAGVEKDRAPDRAAAAPERRGRFAAGLVDVVVQQVPVLRKEARIGRGIVIGADDGVDAGMILQKLRHAPDEAGRHDHVRNR